ncbi:UDP-N-acetylglucosamine 1-carboxyvinyltransferase [Candidatus Kaiserbacteria bacterium]|nr:UDP-N-acetylglucosamine 1-carboxyvinyltransferase [Candidatus Kaiserbacteria bacterium]
MEATPKTRPVINFTIEGGHKLSGTVTTSTSKNGAVALLCAVLLNKGTTVLHDVPKIEEVNRLIEVLQSIGVGVTWEGTSIRITPPAHLAMDTIDEDAARMTRSIIMYFGPLIHDLQDFRIPQSGGCNLGQRTVRPHFYALEPLGVSVETEENYFHVTHGGLAKDREIILYEAGDTVTENALMAAAKIPGTTTIKFASANYMVQETCFFLEQCGVKIEGIGTSTLIVHGVEEINETIEYTLSEDPIDAMFFIASAIVTDSKLAVIRAPIAFLELELLKLEKMGLRYEKSGPYLAKNGKTKLVDLIIHPSKLKALEDKIHALPYPGINQDNLPFFVVIAAQAEGQTLIHDWTYDGRAVHYTELEKLGAKVLLADPHRVFVTGPTEWQAADIICPPALRPAAILLIGMLAAEGTSTLRNVYTIQRGYQNIAERLAELGAKITTRTDLVE